MIEIRVLFDLEFDTGKVLELLHNNFNEILWSEAATVESSDLVISRSVIPVTVQETLILGKDTSIDEIPSMMNRAIEEHSLFLPTKLGKQTLESSLKYEMSSIKELRDNNPLVISPEEALPDALNTGTYPLACHLVHGTAMKRKAPKLEAILSARVYRSLQRNIPLYVPAKSVGAPDTEYAYLRAPTSGGDLRKRVQSVSSELETLGVKPSASTLDRSQINMGIPTPGGIHRDSSGLLDPNQDLCDWMEFTADFMLRGLAQSLCDEGESSFAESNVRVGVKAANYQGPYLNTKSHAVRQTVWGIMLDNDDIFHFSWLLPLATNGQRTQSNGVGKKRPSTVPGPDNSVYFTRVVDGDDLQNLEIACYEDANAVQPSFTIDDSSVGGRKRIVANLCSYTNDALQAVPAYLGATKDKLYKAVYQQDLAILRRFATGTDEFLHFWEEGYSTSSTLRDLVAENFQIKDLAAFVSYVCETGERVSCGDVVKYDASATLKFVSPFFRRLLSDKAFEAVEAVFSSDKIGVYTDHVGIKRFYYVTCNNDPSFPKWKRELVDKTRDAMSSLPSGSAITAQGGRGPVLAVLLHLFQLVLVELGVPVAKAKKLILEMPEFGSSVTWCFMTAWVNDGGDDHNVGLLIIHLITGATLDKCEEVLHKVFSEYKYLEIEPEFPKTNCGYRFHDDEKGRCISISLAPERMWDNNVYPEYPKSFLGLRSSMDLYVASAIGTPVEDQTVKLAELIITKIYNLSGYEELCKLADIENTFINSEAGQVTPRIRIANFLGVPENDLEYKYELSDLLALGVPEEWIDDFRRPIPEELTVNPFKFFNNDSLRKHPIVVSKKKSSMDPTGTVE